MKKYEVYIVKQAGTSLWGALLGGGRIVVTIRVYPIFGGAFKSDCLGTYTTHTVRGARRKAAKMIRRDTPNVLIESYEVVE